MLLSLLTSTYYIYFFYNSASFIQKFNFFSPRRETCEITFFNVKLVAAGGSVSEWESLENVPNHSPQSNAEV